jgi:dihydrofolate reductase
MIVSMIAAMGQNRVIGKGNQMMWYLPMEFKYFKDTTLGHCLITGRKNFEAQGRPLPGRTNIIVTRSKDLKIEGCVVVNSIQEGIDYAKAQGETEAFITGGGQIYKEGLLYADKIYLTEVDFTEDGEVFFPEFDESDYVKSLVKSEDVSEKNSLKWNAYLYTKK